jgi:HK97 family phage portal protein
VLLESITRGVSALRASVTLNNINLSQEYDSQALRGIVPLTGNRHATYHEIYRSQPWVRAAINRIARGIGRLPLHVYTSPRSASGRQRVRDGQLHELLSRPWARGNPTALKQGIVFNLLIHGNAIVLRASSRPGGPVTALLPTNFQSWRIDGPDDYWFYPRDGSSPFRVNPDEILHFRDWATGRGEAALSPLEALRSTLMTEDAAQRAIISAFERGARPIGAFSVDGVLKEGLGERLRAKLEETYGGAENFNRILLLEGGARWQDMGAKFVDMELLGLREITREEVAAVFNIPPPAIGILDNATYSNITEQHLMEYMDSYGPIVTLIEETLQSWVDFDPYVAGQYVEFSYKEILRGDPIREMGALTAAVGGPWMTVNEGRATQNLPDLDDEEAQTLRPSANTSRSEEPEAVAEPPRRRD